MPSTAQETSITPPAGPLPNHTVDMIVDAEFLYWYGGVNNLSYAIEGKTIFQGSTNNPTETRFVPTKKLQLDRSWDPGARVGLGVITAEDGWDVYANWTYFYNSYSETSTVPVFTNSDFSPMISTNPVGTKALHSSWFLFPSDQFLRKVSASWSLLFNQIDLQLGRKFWVSCFLNMRPFVGLRGYWSRMDFDVKGSRPAATDATFYETRSDYEQKSWGVGLLAGLDTAWEFVRNWSFFATGSFALPYGKTWVERESHARSVNQAGQTVLNVKVDTEDTLYKLQPFIDLALGIRWEKAFTAWRILLDAGWENHILIDYNNLFRGTPDQNVSSVGLPNNGGDLSLSGIVIRGRVEF